MEWVGTVSYTHLDVYKRQKLGRIGAWAGQNKYLGAIKNAFQNFMPATIAGAIGVLWTNVLITDAVVNGAPVSYTHLNQCFLILFVEN